MNNIYFEILERYALGGIVSQQEIEQLTLWIKNNPQLVRYIEEQTMSMPSTLDKEIVEKNLQEIYRKIGYKPSTLSLFYRKIKPILLIAALWIIPLVSLPTILYFFISEFRSQQVTLSVNKGEKVQMLLPDSSKVWMNADTKINYTTAYNIGDRSIELDGEAFFEVKHNAKLPFRVKSTNMNVEVLGTSFVIRDYKQDPTSYTVLKEGSLQVITNLGTTLLQPNEKIEYNRLTKQYSHQKSVDANDYTAWIDNILRFEGESFEQMIKTMERIYNVTIVIQTEKLKGYRFTGTVPNNGVESILKCIALSVPIQWEKKGEVWYVEKSQR